MGIAAVDTGILVGLADTDDSHHPTASDIVRQMDHGNLPTGHVPDVVVHETLNWIHSRLHHETATEVYRRLDTSAGFDIQPTAKKDFDAAVELFERHGSLSFGDAAIVAYMKRTGTEYLYAFDDDFDRIEGITRLATPVNPFA
jgi:predicted nucleic acid-binding protein